MKILLGMNEFIGMRMSDSTSGQLTDSEQSKREKLVVPNSNVCINYSDYKITFLRY